MECIFHSRHYHQPPVPQTHFTCLLFRLVYIGWHVTIPCMTLHHFFYILLREGEVDVLFRVCTIWANQSWEDHHPLLTFLKVTDSEPENYRRKNKTDFFFSFEAEVITQLLLLGLYPRWKEKKTRALTNASQHRGHERPYTSSCKEPSI